MKFDKTGLEEYVTDANLEMDGVWLKFPGERRFLVRRAGGSNHKFQRTLQRLIRPYRRQMDRGTLAPEKVTEILREAYASDIFLDWDGIVDEEGDEVPFGKESVMAFMEAFPEVFSEIVERAGDPASFSEALIDEATEELGKS